MASEELQNSLRSEIDSFVRTRLNEVHEQILRVQDEINEAFMRLREQRPDETSTVDESLVDKISDHLRSAHEAGMHEGVSASKAEKDASGIAVLKGAIDDIDDQRSQADILNMLVNRSTSFAPRVAFFVVRSERIIGWRARGLEGTVGDNAVRDISIPLSSETSLGEAVRSRATWSGPADTYEADEAVLEKIGGPLPERLVAIPLVVRGKSVAVLYADSNGLAADSINVEGLESLVRVSAMAVELLAVTRAAPVARPTKVEEEPQAAPDATEAAAQPQTEAQAEPETATAEETEETAPAEEAGDVGGATFYEPPPPIATEAAEPEPGIAEAATPVAAEQEQAPEAQPVQSEAPAAYEAQPAEDYSNQYAETSAGFQVSEPVAIETPQPADSSASPNEPATAGSVPYSAPVAAGRKYGSNDAELPVDVNEDEKRLHNDARRFARLLVSEIKLYNEQKVREGRIEGNLYDRLREDIDRSREMYQKRVSPPVAARYDYFHAELVNTLAEGDPAKLGNSYPSAAV